MIGKSESSVNFIKSMLPAAEIYAYESAGALYAFVGVDNGIWWGYLFLIMRI